MNLRNSFSGSNPRDFHNNDFLIGFFLVFLFSFFSFIPKLLIVFPNFKNSQAESL